MTGAVTWEILIFLGTVVFATATIVFAFFKLLHSARRDANEAISTLTADLAAHKLYAAEHFATREGVNKELDRMSAKLDRIDGKIDRVLAKSV